MSDKAPVTEPSWDCPSCGLTVPKTQYVCDCGYDRDTGVRPMPRIGEHDPAVLPWHRFWARWTDWMIGSVLVLGLLPLEVAKELNPSYRSVMVVLGWIPIESMLLALAGTTPGKLLFNVYVVTDEGRPPLGTAFQRTLLATIVGGAIGTPLISLVAYGFGYSRLKKSGTTYWDRESGTKVIHGEVGRIRAVLILFVVLAGLGAFVSQFVPQEAMN